MDKEREASLNIREAQKLKIEQFLNRLVKGDITDKTEILKISDLLNLNLSTNAFCIACIKIECYFDNKNDMQERQLLRFSILNIAEEIMANRYNGYIFSDDVDSLCAFIQNPNSVDDLRNVFTCIVESVSQYIKQDIYIGCSLFHQDIVQCTKAYKEADICLKSRFFDSGCSVFFTSKQDDGEVDIILFNDKDIREVMEHLWASDINWPREFIHSRFSNIDINSPFSIDYVYFMYFQFIAIVNNYMQDVKNKKVDGDKNFPFIWKKIEDFRTITEVRDFMICALEDCVKENKGSHSKEKTIERVKEYVNEHYNENLSLDVVSKYVHMNPSYFCRLFKSVTNEKFSSYVTSLRISKAVQLLKSTELKVYEISEMVGYKDYAHFSETFKKYIGTTAIEYRKNNESKNIR